MHASSRQKILKSSTLSPQGKKFLRAGAAATVGLGLIWACRGLAWDVLLTHLRAAPSELLIGGVLLFGLNLYSKATCWRFLLGDQVRIPFFMLLRYTFGAFALSVILPVRAGEAMRIWLLRERHQVPVSTGLSVAAMEKVLDIIVFLSFVGPLPWLMPGLPSWLRQGLIWAEIGSTLGLGLLFFISLQLDPRRWPNLESWILMFRRGRRWRLGAGMFSLAVGRMADLSLVWLMLHAVGLYLPKAVGLAILLMVNLAIAVPSTPGQMGALELGAAATLQMLSVPTETALAFGLLYHAVQVVPLLVYLACDARFFLKAIGERAKERRKTDSGGLTMQKP